MTDHIGKAVATALAGALIGWVGQSLTLAGRVSAIEQSLARIEARIYAPDNHRKEDHGTQEEAHAPAAR